MSSKSTASVLVLFVLSLVFLTGCPVDEFSDASITSLSLSRTTFTVSETGMTDEFIDAEVTTSGLIDPINPDESEIFLQDLDRAAVPMSSSVEGDVLLLDGIATSWLSGLNPGQHNVGATVVTSTERVTQLNLATITITE